MEGNAGSFEDSPRHPNSRMSFDEPQELDYSNHGNGRDAIAENVYREEQRHHQEENHNDQHGQYHYNREVEPVHEEVIQEDELDHFKRSQAPNDGEKEVEEEKHAEIANDEAAPEEESENCTEQLGEKENQGEGAQEESIDHHDQHHSVSVAVIEFDHEQEEEAPQHFHQHIYQQEVHISAEPQVRDVPQNENKTPSPPPSRKVVNDFKFEESKPAMREDQGEKDIKRGTVKGLISMWNNPDELSKQGQTPSKTNKNEYGAGSEKPRRQLRNNWCE